MTLSWSYILGFVIGAALILCFDIKTIKTLNDKINTLRAILRLKTPPLGSTDIIISTETEWLSDAEAVSVKIIVKDSVDVFCKTYIFNDKQFKMPTMMNTIINSTINKIITENRMIQELSAKTILTAMQIFESDKSQYKNRSVIENILMRERDL